MSKCIKLGFDYQVGLSLQAKNALGCYLITVPIDNILEISKILVYFTDLCDD